MASQQIAKWGVVASWVAWLWVVMWRKERLVKQWQAQVRIERRHHAQWRRFHHH
jgi:hypothetical protein